MLTKKQAMDADKVIARAIQIYNREGGKEGTFQVMDYETSHSYCVRAQKELRREKKQNRRVKMEIFRPIKNKVDAKDWAEEFVRMVKIKPKIATDVGTMITWFSNTIMAGWDKGYEQRNPKVNEYLEKEEHPVLPLVILGLDEQTALTFSDLRDKINVLIDVINDMRKEKEGSSHFDR